ncbi:WhiB family transcriptional regulator [Rhodococcus antarcticus]|uniref:WhiB family transcriptional regulator n=1 Tax=Rhodococcus antarcticus TaxID=2987751 RepID=UPI0025B6E5A0|nr:WhiB family transcriptional regulator [Rhodococcus antarcticus]
MNVDEARAKAVCARCPVLVLCREDALDRREPHGIWGGTSPRDRRELVVVDGA